MKIALLLNRKKSDKKNVNEEMAIVFNLEEGKVVGVENESLESKDANYLSLWALAKKIKEIYIPDVDEAVKNIFGALGINIMRYDELEDNRLFNTFILQ